MMNGMRRAFTLVESIIYLALAMVVALGLVYFLAAISESRMKATAISEVQSAEREVFSVLKSLVSEASAINWSASSLEQNFGRLVLINAVGQQQIISLNDNGYLVVIRDGEELKLINSLLIVKKIWFSRLDDRTVAVNFELSYKAGESTRQLEYTGAWQTALTLAN